MRRISTFGTGAVLSLLLAIAACGESAESRNLPPRAAIAGSIEPWDTLAADSIYGAGPVENLHTLPVDLDLLGIPLTWEGMRIAVISDLQLGLWRENADVASAAVRTALAANPDLVVLLGDYLAIGGDPAELTSVLAPLRGHPVLAVLGDRDARSDSLAASITRTLSAQGIRVLSNSSVPWVFHGDTALIAGTDPRLALAPEGDQEWILSQLGVGTRLGLLLTHDPMLAARTRKGRFPGVLAGNTFCGSVTVPGTPRLSWLDGTALPGAAVPGQSRFFRFGTTVMFVTCGTGYGFIPVRFGAPPEVALVTLHPVAQGSAAAAAGSTPKADSASMDTLLRHYQADSTTAIDTAVPADTAG